MYIVCIMYMNILIDDERSDLNYLVVSCRTFQVFYIIKDYKPCLNLHSVGSCSRTWELGVFMAYITKKAYPTSLSWERVLAS